MYQLWFFDYMFCLVGLDINLRVKKLLKRIVFTTFPVALQTCEEYFTSPELKEYLKETKSLDLVIIDSCAGECGAAIAYKYKAKTIIFSTQVHRQNVYDMLGFSPESGSIPEYEINPPKTPMSFLERVFNTLQPIHYRYEHWKYMQELGTLARKYLDVDQMPFLDEVMRNTSLVLYTGDIITDYPRSLPPLFVNIAGIHCREGKSLPENVEAFINGSNSGQEENDGFVYISLGSLVISSNLPEEVKKVFFDTIGSYPQLKFLWKWDGKVPDEIPRNLYLLKWFPQQDILAHPKIKAFITQNGRPSTLESVYHAVPMISFPVVGDQDLNSNRMNELGVNVILELGTVTRDELKDALQKVISYRVKMRMKELQKMFMDRPSTPLDTAVWWTEYVLRYSDTSHLRPTGFSQTWYQRRLLDVWTFVFFIGVIIALALITFAIFLLKCSKTCVSLLKSKLHKEKNQ